MWIKDKVNDCYKMSHSHLITIEKVNRHYILYFRDRMIKSFPTLTAAKQYGDFFQLDSHTRYAIYLIHNFGNCTGNNLGYYTGTIGLQGDIYVPGHVPTINGEVKLYKTFARAKQGAQAIQSVSTTLKLFFSLQNGIINMSLNALLTACLITFLTSQNRQKMQKLSEIFMIILS